MSYRARTSSMALAAKNVAPVPCVFPPWLRQIASQGPVAVRWYALAFAYDGQTVYVRLLGLGKPETDPDVIEENRRRSGRATPEPATQDRGVCS